ncbi:MAG: DUF3386 domain-containing protein [Leptolyngbyaceae cyanobacterium CRU_2_3]|nr:DUF3386 domain-containing protein [Leptolyngbyaceae cyanobacterium CRU_2_3]
MTEQVIEKATEQREARDLFRAAYENRYTWDENFPGYTADVTLREGETVHTGKLSITPDPETGNLNHTVTEVADEDAQKAIAGQAWEIAVHRVRRAFDETHGKNLFTLGAIDESGAVEIVVSGKAMGDRYKVRNNEVSLVHRHIHSVVVTINTLSSHQTEQGYLSHRYDSVYHDVKTGDRKGSQLFEDEYEKVGNYYILNRRVITDQKDKQAITSEFLFSNIQLLN